MVDKHMLYKKSDLETMCKDGKGNGLYSTNFSRVSHLQAVEQINTTNLNFFAPGDLSIPRCCRRAAK